MKAILALCCLLVCAKGQATLPGYSDVRAFVEKHAAGNPIPATNRIFVAFEQRAAVVVPYQHGMRLEHVIKQSGFGTNKVFIFVFRGQGQDKAGAHPDPVYDSRFTKTKISEFVVRPLDAIDLVDVRTPIN